MTEDKLAPTFWEMRFFNFFYFLTISNVRSDDMNVMLYRYVLDMSYREIGRLEELSGERVRQKINRAIQTMRFSLKKKKYMTFIKI